MVVEAAADLKLDGHDHLGEMTKRCVQRNYQVSLLTVQGLRETLKNKLTGDKEGLSNILESEHELVNSVLTLINEEDNDILKNAFTALINISAKEEGSKLILELQKQIIAKLTQCICNPDYLNADLACALLANLSHPLCFCPEVLQKVENAEKKFEDLIKAFSFTKHNKKGENLNHLGSVIANCTQVEAGRKLILNNKNHIFELLLPFLHYPDSIVRRKATVSAIHNCCFEKGFHEWMLSEDIDIAAHLVLPLAGPDSFSAEENESLPLDLQYLPDDKTREEDTEIRVLLLESFMQLCTTKKAREILRDSNIYLILREHHKWEQDKKCIELNEDVVNFLIRTEEEIGHEDISKLKIPAEFINFFSETPPNLATS